jgi:hypothetical protein
MTTMFAGDFCSMVVKVKDPDGNYPVVDVKVEEHDGRITVRANEAGGVRFCNLGITPVTISVGHPACNQVVVHNVGLIWGQTSHVAIIYDRAPCLMDPPPVAACQFLLRFVRSTSSSVVSLPQFVKNVVLKMSNPHEEIPTADEYGRLLVRVRVGQELRGVVSAEGYATAELNIPCTGDSLRSERYITLNPVDRR